VEPPELDPAYRPTCAAPKCSNTSWPWSCLPSRLSALLVLAVEPHWCYRPRYLAILRQRSVSTVRQRSMSISVAEPVDLAGAAGLTIDSWWFGVAPAPGPLGRPYVSSGGVAVRAIRRSMRRRIVSRSGSARLMSSGHARTTVVAH